jgi:hypothetical protein
MRYTKIITEEGFSISGYKGNLESGRIAMQEYGKNMRQK